MKRGKKIIFLSHCILNANAKVGGLATYPGALKELVAFLMDRDVGIVQLPCPEIQVLGLKRWGHVKDQLSHPFFIQCCKDLLTPVVEQVEMYGRQGHVLIGVVGIDGSPCCGVDRTCRSENWGEDFLDPERTWDKVRDLKWTREPGIFMEVFQQMLAKNHLELKFFSLDESDARASVPRLTQALSAVLDRI